MYAEGELRNNLDDSDRVRELQDKVAELKAEVRRLTLVAFSIYASRFSHAKLSFAISRTA